MHLKQTLTKLHVHVFVFVMLQLLFQIKMKETTEEEEKRYWQKVMQLVLKCNLSMPAHL